MLPPHVVWCSFFALYRRDAPLASAVGGGWFLGSCRWQEPGLWPSCPMKILAAVALFVLTSVRVVSVRGGAEAGAVQCKWVGGLMEQQGGPCSSLYLSFLVIGFAALCVRALARLPLWAGRRLSRWLCGAGWPRGEKGEAAHVRSGGALEGGARHGFGLGLGHLLQMADLLQAVVCGHVARVQGCGLHVLG